MSLQQYERLRDYLSRGQYRRQFFPGFSWMDSCPQGVGKASRIRSIEGLVRRLPADLFVLADLLVTAWELLISEAQNFPQFRLHEEFFLFVNLIREAIAAREGLPQITELERPEEGTPRWVGPNYWYEGTDSIQPPQWIPILSAALEVEDADLISFILADESGERIGGANEMNTLFDPLPFPFYELMWQEQRIIESLLDWLESGEREVVVVDATSSQVEAMHGADFEGYVEEGLVPIVHVLAGIYASLQLKMAAMEDPRLVLRAPITELRRSSSRSRTAKLVREAIQAFTDRWIDLVLCRYPVRGVRQIEY